MTTTSQTSHLFSNHLSSSQFSQLSSQSCSISSHISHLSSTIFTSSLLFSNLLDDSHVGPPRLNSSQIFSTRLNSSHLLPPLQLFPPLLTSAQVTSPLSQLISTLLTFSTLANSAYLLSQRCLHTEQVLTRRSIYTQQTLTQRSSYTQKLLHTANFYTQQVFAQRSFYTYIFFTEHFFSPSIFYRVFLTQSRHLHTAFFYTKKLHIKSLNSYTKRNFYTEKMLHRASFFTAQAFAQRSSYTENFLHKANFYTQQANKASSYTGKLLHRASFFTQQICAQRSSCTEKFLHKANSYTENFLHTASLHKANFCTEKLFQQVFTQRSCYTGCAKIEKYLLPKHHPAAKAIKVIKNIPREAAAARNLDAAIPLRSAEAELQNTMELRTAAAQIAAPKPDRPSGKTTILKHFLTEMLKGNSSAPKRKINSCQNTIRNFQAAITMRFTALSSKTH